LIGARLLTQSVSRALPHLRPDPGRVIAVLFVPGEEMTHGDSRAVSVAKRILAMDDADVAATLHDLEGQFAYRHRRLQESWSAHFQLAARRLGGIDVPAEKSMLMGAYFTREVSLEGAALFNPSMVAHPDQSGLGTGDIRFIMSLRAVGEGHISCIEFRTGTVSASGTVSVDTPGRFTECGRYSPGPYRRHLFHRKLAERGHDNQAAALVLDRLKPRFGPEELNGALEGVHTGLSSRPATGEALADIRWVAANNYTVDFAADTRVDERVLWPHGPSESHGLEDARFVRFVDEDKATYLATYTAFDQVSVASHLLTTTDFRSFGVCQLTGPFAADKGMALFPRRIAGRYVALSRWDREHLAVAFSDDLSDWAEASTLPIVPEPWEIVQIGNCGSPIETPRGWLVLTHGVGPMRVYGMGAVLLDLDDPRRVIGKLAQPMLVPSESERDGYVPNVVYSCGALVHGQMLVLPYAFSDSAVAFARVDIGDVLSALTGPG
jgi:predicted GH43/DUF377 family glycosyl hydrolase